MINKFIFFAFLSCFNAFSQQKITGIITDSLNNPIAYANIGIASSSFGTVSDSNGNFSFEIQNYNPNDTLRISSLGFKTKDLFFKNITQNQNLDIKLAEEVTILEELKLLTGNLKLHTEGKTKTDTKNHVIFANSKMANLNLGTEIGRRFDLGSKKPSLLTEAL